MPGQLHACINGVVRVGQSPEIHPGDFFEHDEGPGCTEEHEEACDGDGVTGL